MATAIISLALVTLYLPSINLPTSALRAIGLLVVVADVALSKFIPFEIGISLIHVPTSST